MYEIIQNKVGTFLKVRSEFTSKDDGKEIKLTRYFQLAEKVNIGKLETRLSLQSPDFLRKNVEETLVPKGICEPVNPAELVDDMMD